MGSYNPIIPRLVVNLLPIALVVKLHSYAKLVSDVLSVLSKRNYKRRLVEIWASLHKHSQGVINSSKAHLMGLLMKLVYL